MLKSLRIKFICIVMSVVTVMMGIIFGLIVVFTKKNIEDQSREMMQRIEDNLMNPLGGYGNRGDVFQPYFVVSIDIFGMASLTRNGISGIDEAYVNEVVNAALATGTDESVLKEYSLRYKHIRGFGTEYLLFVDISGEKSTLGDLARVCAVIGITSLFLFFLLAYLLARWAVRPVEKAWDQQKQFVSDASHELKTPLTVILTDIGMLRDEECDEETRAKLTDSISAMSVQMRGLVEGLLELARADNGQVRKNMTDVVFSDIVSDAVLPFEPLCYEKNLLLASETEPDIRVRGSARHLGEVVQILLDNAMKYSLPGEISVRLHSQGKNCVLTVSNPAPQMTQRELTDIFKRFYRADKARSMNHSYGLGLPIAESIVSEHGGKIRADYRDGNITFIVTLPLI